MTNSAYTWDCGATPGTVTATLSCGTLTISGTGAMKDYDCAGSSLGPPPWHHHSVGSIATAVIENGVTAIGDWALAGTAASFMHIMSITIPDSVISIGNAAFWGCDNITSITIPRGVISIGDTLIFTQCENLTNIEVDSGNTVYCSIDGVLFNKGTDTLIRYPEGKQGTHYTIPNGVKSIGKEAFCNCMGLTSITIPDSVTSIGAGAFFGCSGLTSITIPSSVTSIDGMAFYDCDGLTSITIPNGVTIIGDSAFENCGSLISIALSDGVISIGKGVFQYTNLTSITIPQSVAFIGDGAFENCDRLTNIEVESGNIAYCSIDGVLFNIGKDTLLKYPECKHGAYYTIPDSVKYIRDNAFHDCTDLMSVTIPNGVITIGGNAFSGCTSLTSINIPDSVTSIGSYAFYSCTNLTFIDIPNSVIVIGSGAFDKCTDLKSATIPNSVTFIICQAFNHCCSLTNIDVESSNKVYSSIDGVLFSKGKDTLVRYPEGKQDAHYAIPNSVKSIGKWAFFNCSYLSSISIPDSVTSIERGAFDCCSDLTSITIPNRVTSIGVNAFCACKKLTTITCLNAVPPKFKQSSSFDGKDKSSVCLYVPENSIDAYRTAYGWKKFACIRAVPISI